MDVWACGVGELGIEGVELFAVVLGAGWWRWRVSVVVRWPCPSLCVGMAGTLAARQLHPCASARPARRLDLIARPRRRRVGVDPSQLAVIRERRVK